MKSLVFSLAFIFLFSCQPSDETQTDLDENPPMEGFNLEGSDSKAIALADTVMKSMGGRKNWDDTRYIQWTFFGRRKLLWDKWDGNVRIEFTNDSTTIYILNLHSMSGSVKKSGEIISHPDSLAKELERAEAIWINDSYWLCMPFKLKDTGVTLKYLREDTTLAGEDADVLGLTFENVGNTPNNKYELWVSHNEKLITQWAYFRQASQDSASFIRPFDNYQKYGNILLSGDRSDNGGPGDIRVLEEIPDGAFTALDPILK